MKIVGGGINVGSDQQLQAELFGSEVAHPATNNLKLIGRLIERYSQVGDLVADPMAGLGGTGLLAARNGRHAYCRDCEADMQELGSEAWERMTDQGSLLPYGTFTYEVGDAREAWSPPQAPQAIIFSPPFWDSLPSDNRDAAYWDRFFDEKEERDGRLYTGTRKAYSRTYGAGPNNIGKLAALEDWSEQMQWVYERCRSELAPGGTIAVILRNLMRGGELVPLVHIAQRNLVQAGFRDVREEIRELTQIGLWTRVRERRGERIIRHESVLIGTR